MQRTSGLSLLRTSFFAAAIFAGAICASPARASVITYNFIAGAVTGSVSYDLAGVCTNGSCSGGTGYAYYTDPNFIANVNYGGTLYTFSYSLVIDYKYYGSIDQLEFYNGSSPLGYFNVNLFDNTGTALSSIAIPATINPALFGTLNVQAEGNTYTMTSFTAAASQPAPEPASITVLGAGLAGLGFLRRRQKARAARIR